VRLRARAARAVGRRRFPGGDPPGEAAPVPAAEELWRSPAFEGEGGVLAAARAGDGASARALVDRWIDEHPPRDDDAWHPYPLSTRVGNWIAALTLVPELASPELSGSLWRQLRRLEANVEDDVLGNHVIRNARALVLGGAAFEAPWLTRRGIDLLRRELPQQVLADGGHYGRSPVRHLVVLRDLLEVQAVSPHSWIGDAIGRMRDFAAALARPDGAPALFNDGGLDEAPLLELPEPPEGLVVFEHSGFAVVREGPLWLAFRCGPFPPAFLSAEAHADALSFQVWWNGAPVLVDAGAYTAETGPERDRFRATAAHSTIAVDGRDQLRLRGGRPPEVKFRFAREGVLEASILLRRHLRHVRRLEWGGDEILVRDLLDGLRKHRIESRLLWAPGADERVELAVYGPGERHEEPAWVSERLGERAETRATTVRARLKLPAELGFRIRCLE